MISCNSVNDLNEEQIQQRLLEEQKILSMQYVELRIAKYPSIHDQLDMIYWDKVNGTTVWLDAIAAVKKQYPKSNTQNDAAKSVGE